MSRRSLRNEDLPPPPPPQVFAPWADQKLLKWGLSGRGSNLLKSDRPLTSSTPGWSATHRAIRSAAARRAPGCGNSATLQNENPSERRHTELSGGAYATARMLRRHPESEDCARRKAFLPETAAPTASSAAPTGPPGGRYGSTAGPHVCAVHEQ
jgi:hypothetical protein